MRCSAHLTTIGSLIVRFIHHLIDLTHVPPIPSPIMSILSLFFVAATVLVLSVTSSPVASASIEAEQVHLSLGMSQNDFYVNYVTFARPSLSYVQYGLSASDLSLSSNASIALFTDGGKAQKQRYMHQASMLHLKPGVVYFYQVITDTPATAPLFNFTTISDKAGYTQPLRVAMYGDYGVVNAQSHDRLQAESLQGNLDLIIHAGDFAYDMNNEDGDRGDLFMNQQQSFLSHTPMQTCAGTPQHSPLSPCLYLPRTALTLHLSVPVSVSPVA